MTQRIVDSAMREYLSMDSDDESGLLPMAWMSSNEGSKSRLAGLMIQQAGVSQLGFREASLKIREASEGDFQDLRSRILRRDPSMSDIMDSS